MSRHALSWQWLPLHGIHVLASRFTLCRRNSRWPHFPSSHRIFKRERRARRAGPQLLRFVFGMQAKSCFGAAPSTQRRQYISQSKKGSATMHCGAVLATIYQPVFISAGSFMPHLAKSAFRSIYFDVLRPGKGVLVQIWHNSQDVSKISINAISDQFSRTLVGLHHPMNPKIVKWMNTMAYWLVLPAAALTVVFMLSHNTAASVMSGVFTWMLIVSAYLNWRCEPRAPEDLGFRNDKAKIFFYHGPG